MKEGAVPDLETDTIFQVLPGSMWLLSRRPVCTTARCRWARMPHSARARGDGEVGVLLAPKGKMILESFARADMFVLEGRTPGEVAV